MTNQELATKLNSLKKIAPEAEWVKSNRELLLSQISNSTAVELSVWKTFIINFRSLAKAASQPAIALGIFVAALISGSVFSHQIFAQTKPNDSLYIARIISEKVRLNTMFDSKQRDKLAVQFASEHAQDITEVLSDPEFNTEENSAQVARLNNSFNKEVETVKSRISHLTPASEQAAPKVLTEEDDSIVIADSAKDDKGLEYLAGTEAEVPNASSTTTTDASVAPTVATSSETAVADKILDEAKELFDKKEYNSALNKLKEVDEIIK